MCASDLSKKWSQKRPKNEFRLKERTSQREGPAGHGHCFGRPDGWGVAIGGTARFLIRKPIGRTQVERKASKDMISA